MRRHDFIIYGASGYAAGYIIEAFKKENVRVALAARNIERIENNTFPVYECEIDDIDRIAPLTRILINCVGPYCHHGEKIVKSCLRNKTHYMDISGEVYFLELITRKYHDEAARRGVWIINCCGFDSVVADIGVMHLRDMFDIAHVESILSVRSIVVNLTTWESLVTSLGNFERTVALRREKNMGARDDTQKRLFNKETTYQVLFRGSDYQVVMRSQMLMKSVGLKAAKYSAYLDVGGKIGMIKYCLFVFLTWFIAGFYVGRKIAMSTLCFLTFGLVKRNPSFDSVKKASFKIRMMAKGRKNGEKRTCKLVISGPDPVYISTSVCLVQTALTLLEYLDDRGDKPRLFKGGVLTPACISYNTSILRRLMLNGIKFEVVE